MITVTALPRKVKAADAQPRSKDSFEPATSNVVCFEKLPWSLVPVNCRSVLAVL